jgi:cytoskeletal protein RodZ
MLPRNFFKVVDESEAKFSMWYIMLILVFVVIVVVIFKVKKLLCAKTNSVLETEMIENDCGSNSSKDTASNSKANVTNIKADATTSKTNAINSTTTSKVCNSNTIADFNCSLCKKGNLTNYFSYYKF